MPGGVVENEMCPVFTAVTADPVRAVPAEVDDFAWVDWADFRRSVLDGGRAVSPWCAEQVRLLPSDPLAEPPAVGALPHAAR
jgi:isopentenyl-diphosphate delta-isomerase